MLEHAEGRHIYVEMMAVNHRWNQKRKSRVGRTTIRLTGRRALTIADVQRLG